MLGEMRRPRGVPETLGGLAIGELEQCRDVAGDRLGAGVGVPDGAVASRHRGQGELRRVDVGHLAPTKGAPQNYLVVVRRVGRDFGIARDQDLRRVPLQV